MLKGMLSADLHIDLKSHGRTNPETGVNTTVEKYIQELNDTLDRGIAKGIEFWIIAGDAFHSRNPSNFAKQAFTACIERARQKGIEVFVMLGNHDIQTTMGAKNNLTELAVMDIQHLKVIEKSCIIQIKDLQVIFLPWQKDYQQIEKDAKFYIDAALPTGKTIVVGHFTVAGGRVGTEQMFELTGKDTVPLELFNNSKLLYSFFGHLHTRQTFKKQGVKAAYIGSMERIDFSERDQEKGSLYIELEGRDLKIEVLKGNPRQFRQYEFDSIQQLKDYAFAQLAGAVVKIEVTCTKHEKKTVKLDDVYRKLKQCEYVLPIKFIVAKDEKRDESKTMSKELQVGEALKIWVNQQDISEELKADVLKEGQRLLQEELI